MVVLYPDIIANTIYPDPESLDDLLGLLIKVCESDAVSAITEVIITINNLTIQTPKVETWSNQTEYELHIGPQAQQNKIHRLYVEEEEHAKKRMKKPYRLVKQGKIEIKPKRIFYIDPGLEGVHTATRYIKLLFKNDTENLPEYLQDIKLENFMILVSVIWKMDEKSRLTSDGRYDFCDFEGDNIIARLSHPVAQRIPELSFGFDNSNNYTYNIYTEENYLNHLDTIQKAVDEVAPGKYEVDPEDRELLLKIGYLKREGRLHVIPNPEEIIELKEKEERVLKEYYG
ncbi:MAG: hypothetical protein ACXABO_19385 [Promethearchaeota archaeon]|jgi:hypothetical protein